jgi:hypothetical protein
MGRQRQGNHSSHILLSGNCDFEHISLVGLKIYWQKGGVNLWNLGTLSADFVHSGSIYFEFILIE